MLDQTSAALGVSALLCFVYVFVWRRAQAPPMRADGPWLRGRAVAQPIVRRPILRAPRVARGAVHLPCFSYKQMPPQRQCYICTTHAGQHT